MFHGLRVRGKKESLRHGTEEKGDVVTRLTEIEGVGDVYAGRLAAVGIATTTDLLEMGSTPHGRTEIAAAADISEKLVLRWVNMVDLFRVKGIGQEYADLLEAAGVDTVPELAQRNADNLHARLLEVNEDKKLVRRPPSAADVSAWIAQAQALPRAISY